MADRNYEAFTDALREECDQIQTVESANKILKGQRLIATPYPPFPEEMRDYIMFIVPDPDDPEEVIHAPWSEELVAKRAIPNLSSAVLDRMTLRDLSVYRTYMAAFAEYVSAQITMTNGYVTELKHKMTWAKNKLYVKLSETYTRVKDINVRIELNPLIVEYTREIATYSEVLRSLKTLAATIQEQLGLSSREIKLRESDSRLNQDRDSGSSDSPYRGTRRPKKYS